MAEPTRAPPDRDWYGDEPRIRTIIIRELQRLKRRMKAHPARVLLLAAIMTSLVVVRFVNKPRFYKARIILRATQGSLHDEAGMPLSSRGLRDRIYDQVFTKGAILDDIIRKHGVHLDTLESLGPDAAIEEVLDPLGVSVVRNYFLFTEREEGSPRSLRLVLSYEWSDPEFAYWMVSLLADMVVSNVQTERLTEARYAVRSAREEVTAVEARVAMHKDRLNTLRYDLTTPEVLSNRHVAAEVRALVQELAEKLETDELQLQARQSELRDSEIQLRAEERNLGLVWDVAGEVRPRRLRPPGPIRLTALALFCFCVFVPLGAIALGTFDSKLHDRDDVARLGMPVVGHIPRFAGDHLGSLRQRGALGRRSLLGLVGLRSDRRVRRDRVA